MGMGAGALAALGESARAREWIERALLIDPDNILLRYNLACALVLDLDDCDAALDLLEPYFEQASVTQVKHAEVDPDMDRLREGARFKAMFNAARARLTPSVAAAAE